MEVTYQLTPHRSRLFEISVQGRESRFKLLQIFFGKKDGSLYVSFPYFHNSQGIVSTITLPAGPQQQSRVSLVQGGKVTSHLVKYSHHLSGLTQFSLTGKVRPLVRRNAVPLENAEGHIFTAYFQGLSGYKEAPSKAPSSRRSRAELVIVFQGLRSDAIKIVGRWYRLSELIPKLGAVPISTTGSEVSFRTPSGGMYTAYLIAPPIGTPVGNRVLALVADTMRPLEPLGGSYLVFVGGFDEATRVADMSTSTTLLALKYPAEDYQELQATIGSIDR